MWPPHRPAEPSSEGTVLDSHGMGSSRAEMGNTDEASPSDLSLRGASPSDLSLRGEQNAQISRWTCLDRPAGGHD
ncbi:hypothetical protein QE152_g22102 [Popillia japonica]|uniref:Uncharacterized protein n=1 Tax=Popillia japonica TaxID=7064 RepID=A0AAW1KM29_POPJA